MGKQETREYLKQLLFKHKVFLFEPSFSEFPLKTVVLRINKDRLNLFPDYYQKYVKAHVMETGYIPYAINYEDVTKEKLKERWNEWYESIEIIKQSILKELVKLPSFKKKKRLPIGFI